MKKKLRVYLDDERSLPAGFDLLVRTAEEAIQLIKEGKVEFISLDSDLGIGYTEGRAVAQFIEKAAFLGEIEPLNFHPHTSNPASWEEIMACKKNAINYFKTKNNG